MPQDPSLPENLSGCLCATCGAPLPIRRAAPGEPEARWICATCGGRYRGVLDENASPDARAFVRQDHPNPA